MFRQVRDLHVFCKTVLGLLILSHALDSGTPADFEAITLGGPRTLNGPISNAGILPNA